MLYCNSLVDCLPTLVIFALLIWTYYMYVIELGIKIIRYQNLVKFALYLIIYHMLFIMVMITYFKVMCANIAVVPNNYRFPPDLYKKIQETETEEVKNELILQFCYKERLTVVTRNDNGYIRACNICKLIKPDRAHHCAVCGTCILKMDHHCPWINNCVGFSNYKFFLLLLFYTSLYCIFLTFTILEYVLRIWQDQIRDFHELHYIIGFCLALLLGTILTCFLCDHLNMLCNNRTTLEKMKATTYRDFNDSLTFDLGMCENITEVFGYNYLTWLLPIKTSLGDGVHYPVQFKI